MAPPLALLLLLLLVVAPPGCSEQGPGPGHDDAGFLFFDTMVGCAPAPPPSSAGATAGAEAAAFRASLAPLLAALPSAAAATGFASLRAARGRGSASASAAGLCFGPAAPRESGCLACLSAAAAAAAAGEGCADDSRAGAVWRGAGCVLLYADEGAYLADGEDGDARARAHPDGLLEQALADLARAVAEPKGRSLWKSAQFVLFLVLATIGAVTVGLLVAAFMFGRYLADTLAAAVVNAGQQAGNAAAAAGQNGGGEWVAVYVVATSGQAPVFSVAAHLRFN